jgi:outer membrane protein assembly factor BamA
MGLLAALGTGCNVTKLVPAGDRLYLGADVQWQGEKQKDQTDLEAGLEERIVPKPNGRILGIPFSLWLYSLGKEPKGKGLNYLLREKWGRPPVLLSQAKPKYTAEVLTSYTEDNGFFQSHVNARVDTVGEKKAKVVYTVTPGIRYYIDSVAYEVDTSQAIGRYIKRTARFSFLRPGRPYSLDQIKEERTHVSNFLKNRGYYYFSPDDLIVLVDSTHQGKVNLFLHVKDSISRAAVTPYRMRRIQIYANYDLRNDSTIRRQKGVPYKDLEIIDRDSLFKPYLFDRSVFLRKDSLYRIRQHTITISRLMNLGTFKFVRSQFTRVRDTSGLLDAKFLLTPYPKRSLQFDLSGNSRSNNYVGSQISIAAKNRNWLKVADLLEMNVSGGFEAQVGGKRQVANNAYNFSAGIGVTIPKFYAPLFRFHPETPYVPRTKIAFNYEFLKMPGLYNLNGFNFQFGYAWKQSRYLDHQLNPIDISFVLPSHTTAAFDSLIQQDLALRNSIQKQFILGSNYTITFNNQSPRRTHGFYLSGNIDIAGNLAGLLVGRSGSGTKDLFGSTFAQYLRLSADGRHYWRLKRNLVWVNRIFAGWGIPYGNSLSLPFVKQFFDGGSNSLRGFRARTLGPGSYNGTTNKYLANEAGDVKLEYNSELRAKLFSIVNGAIFFDAGNIWLAHEDPGRPGSQFRFGSFLNELAADAGVGLRIDASILIVRFDLGVPLRIPYLPEGERWVVNKIDFGSSEWRRDNLILNIAIGYPF